MQRQEQYKNVLKFGFSVVIWGLMVSIWAHIWIDNYANIIMRPFGYKGNWLVIVVYGILLFIFTSFYGGYRIGYYRREDVIFSNILALIFTNTVTYLQTCLIGRALMNVGPFFGMTALQAILAWMWGMGANELYIRMFPPHKMLLVYGGNHLAKSLIQKMVGRSEKYTIQEVIDIDVGLAEICEKVMTYEAVVFCDLPAKLRNRLLKFCFENSIRSYTTPKISDILIRGAVDINLFDTPLLLNRNHGLSFEQRFLKRMVDLVVSSIGLVVASPFMLITAIAIKVYDRGPVLYKQKRLTLNGREFYVYKFRSMIVDAEKKNGAQLSTQNDNRITPIGKVIRMIRFDELPQIWNIFRGDMSIVGPRPERPEIAEQYLKQMPEFGYRLKVKAGLTGFAQVMGKYNTTPYDKLKLDLMYISRFSLLEDFKLILMTIKILFRRESTTGIAEGTKTAGEESL